MIKYRFAVFALGLYAVLLPANALGGKGGPVEPPASALVRARAQFFQAIKERRWEDALRNADQRVRERAAKMGSAEALLRDVAPIDVLMKLADKEPIFSSYGKSLERPHKGNVRAC